MSLVEQESGRDLIGVRWMEKPSMVVTAQIKVYLVIFKFAFHNPAHPGLSVNGQR